MLKNISLRNSSISTRIMFLTGIMLTLVVGVAGLSQYAARRSNNEFTSILDNEILVEEHALHIKSLMLESRRNEKDFFLRLDPKYLENHAGTVETLITETQQLRVIAQTNNDEDVVVRADQIIEFAREYRANFASVAEAWQRKGLDHSSGLQGQFRQAAHDLSEGLVEHGLEQQYIDLLQCRRYEKDFQRTHSDKYRTKFLAALDTMDEHLRLNAVVDGHFRESFEAYRTASVAFVNADEDTSKDEAVYNDVRQRAHDIGAVLDEYYVPRVKERLLTIRKHEKDYLLRSEPDYVAKTLEAVADLEWAFENAPIADKHKVSIAEFLNNYHTGFTALVAEDGEIVTLTAAMRDAVHKIEPLVDEIAESAETQAKQSATDLSAASARMTSIVLAIVGAGIVVAIICAIVLIRMITRPITAIVGSLQTMTEGEGDLSIRLDDSRTNETGQIARAVNAFVVKIQQADQAQAEALAEAQKVSEMMRQMPANVMLCDPDLNLVYMNDASSKTLKGMEQKLPMKADDMIGVNIDIFHENPALQRRILGDPKKYLPHTAEFQLADADITLQADGIWDAQDEFIGCMATWMVITEQKNLERKQEEARQRDLEQKESLESLLANVATSSNEIDQGAQQIAGASQSLSEGAAEQASSLEEISSSLEEMSAMIDQNAENCTQAATLSDECQDSADRGQKEMTDMASAVDEIKNSSSEISKIIKVIDEIAFQTNLLALNAAVEAARAGEAGKGFAVVAEEVRNLAQRSAEAAKSTSSLIEESTQRADNGVAIAHRVGEALEEIVGSTKKVNTLVAEIASASQEQAEGIGQVNKGITELDRVTQQNAGNAEELAAGAQETASQVATLRDLTNQDRDGMSSPTPTTQNDLRRPPAIDPASSKAEPVVATPDFPGDNDHHFPLDTDDSLASF